MDSFSWMNSLPEQKAIRIFAFKGRIPWCNAVGRSHKMPLVLKMGVLQLLIGVRILSEVPS
jgi:hypothetical protein